MMHDAQRASGSYMNRTFGVRFPITSDYILQYFIGCQKNVTRAERNIGTPRRAESPFVWWYRKRSTVLLRQVSYTDMKWYNSIGLYEPRTETNPSAKSPRYLNSIWY